MSDQDVGARLYDGRRGNIFWLDNALIDTKIEEVPEKRRADALAIYTVLARHADKQGVAFPGIQYLRRKTGRSKPTIIAALRALKEMRALVIRERWRDDGGRSANHYILTEITPVKPVDSPPSTPDPPPQGSRIDPKNTKKEEEEQNATRSVARKNGTAPRQQEMERIAGALWQANKLKLNGNEWGFNLTQLSRIYDNDEITIEEMERLPEMAVEYMARWKKLDVRKALRAFRADEIVLPKKRRKGAEKKQGRGESEYTGDLDDVAINR